MMISSLQCAAYFTKLPWKYRSGSNGANLHSEPYHRLRCSRTKCVITHSRRADQLEVAHINSKYMLDEHQQAIPPLNNADDSGSKNKTQDVAKREGLRRLSKDSGKERGTSRGVPAMQAKKGPYPSRDVWKRGDTEGNRAVKATDSSSLNMVRR